MSVCFGPAGFGGDAIEGLHRIARAGMRCAEVEFTYGVRMTNETAKKVGALAKELGIDLSVHAPYYINLASKEKQKRSASMKRILDSCERGHFLGAKYIVFHSGYYGSLSKEEAYELVKDAVLKMQEVIKEKKWKVVLAPETTGKQSQFGDLEELSKLSSETGCAYCIDFAHLKAKCKGKLDYAQVFSVLKKARFSPLTAHFSGIEWGEKGERRHLLTPSSEIRELLYWVKKSKLDFRIINESPAPFIDALRMQRML